ncbi:unnamed protein product [Discosporangium mesarthrocarpum]
MNRIAFYKTKLPRALLVGGALLLAAGCTSGDGSVSTATTSTGNASRTAVGFAQFPDIAVPAGAKMDVERSLVLGARDDWIGRLSMNTSGSTSESYDFFLREMPKFGWQEITTVRSEVSVLTYSRENRVATIQIRSKTLGGSAVDITVSPRGRPPAAFSAGSTMPASPAGAVESVPQR